MPFSIIFADSLCFLCVFVVRALSRNSPASHFSPEKVIFIFRLSFCFRFGSFMDSYAPGSYAYTYLGFRFINF